MQTLLVDYPGISIAVGYGDQVVWKKGFGYADVEENVTVNTDHQFRGYSLSKSITGMALMKLVEEGKLDVEKSITHYLPSIPSTYDAVKVKHLINHTAGVRHYDKGEWMKISQANCASAAEAINVFINDPLEAEPGKTYQYSSFGYTLLSHLVASISGQSFNSYVREKLLAPLDINSLANDQSSDLNNEVSYYSKWNGSKQKGAISKEVNNSCKFGGGGFVGSPEAFVKLHLAMANGQLVSKEILRQYYTKISGDVTDYAYGISDKVNKQGIRYHAHTGSAVGASAVLLIYQEVGEMKKPLIFVAMGNMDDDKLKSKMGTLTSFFIDELSAK